MFLKCFPIHLDDPHGSRAELHSGDVVARFKRAEGLMFSIQWVDAFGLPAENAAIEKTPTPPNDPTKYNFNERTTKIHGALLRLET